MQETNDKYTDQKPHQEALAQLEPLVQAAVTFAEQWDARYRTYIFRTALGWLIELNFPGTHRTSVPSSVLNVGGLAASSAQMQSVAADADAPAAKLAHATGIDDDLLKRLIHIDEEGHIEILGRINGNSVGELQNKYGIVYAYVKEKALGEMHVGIDELREVCKRHGCYDSSNFTRNFRADSRLREMKGGGGRDKQYVATKKGIDDAANLIAEMLES
jgi:hypothetical protein